MPIITVSRKGDLKSPPYDSKGGDRQLADGFENLRFSKNKNFEKIFVGGVIRDYHTVNKTVSQGIPVFLQIPPASFDADPLNFCYAKN